MRCASGSPGTYASTSVEGTRCPIVTLMGILSFVVGWRCCGPARPCDANAGGAAAPHTGKRRAAVFEQPGATFVPGSGNDEALPARREGGARRGRRPPALRIRVGADGPADRR